MREKERIGERWRGERERKGDMRKREWEKAVCVCGVCGGGSDMTTLLLHICRLHRTVIFFQNPPSQITIHQSLPGLPPSLHFSPSQFTGGKGAVSVCPASLSPSVPCMRSCSKDKASPSSLCSAPYYRRSDTANYTHITTSLPWTQQPLLLQQSQLKRNINQLHSF